MASNFDDDFAVLTANIVSAYVSHNAVPLGDVKGLISSIHHALSDMSRPSPAVVATEKLKPAISVRKSVQDDHIVCLECGSALKTLKRHLMLNHNLTPDDYRNKWDLPESYPITAPDYSKTRSRLAREMDLGQVRRRRKRVK